jgi:hypothetical protein
MNYVKIVATLYDKTGKVVGTDFTFSDVDVLRPTERSAFKIILTEVFVVARQSRLKPGGSAFGTDRRIILVNSKSTYSPHINPALH